MPESCKVECNGLILQMKVVHGFGAKETQLNYELFGRINVDASKVIFAILFFFFFVSGFDYLIKLTSRIL